MNYYFTKHTLKVIPKHLFTGVIIFLLALFPLSMYGQNNAVTGTVVDDTGLSLPGVNIRVKGTTVGTISDVDGKFSVKVENYKTPLVFSYMGYTTLEVLPQRIPMKVVMEEDSKTLKEVVVVGFGTQRKVNLTGAVSVVGNKSLSERPTRDAIDMLQGTTAGLNISRNTGNPEEIASINIRGTTTLDEGSNGSPLILIDGIEGSLAGINPQDIESISVLKDAAAASIYGSRAPFGVVLVTTKRGGTQKVRINYNNNFRFSSPIMWPHVSDSETFATVINDNSINNGSSPFFSEEWMDRIRRNKNGEHVPMVQQSNGQWANGYNAGHANVNWFKEVFNENSTSQDHNLSLNGGSKDIQFYISAAISEQDGLSKINTDKYTRYNLSGKVNAKLTSYLDLEFNTRFSRQQNKRPTYLNSGLWNNILRQGWPTMPVYDDNGYLFDNAASPILRLRDGGEQKKYKDEHLYQAKLTIKPLKNWDIIANAAYKTNNTFEQYYQVPCFNHDVKGEPYYSSTKTSNVYESAFKSDYYNISVYSNYKLNIKKHKFHFMAGAQVENHDQRSLWASRNGLISHDVHALDATSGLTVDGEEKDPGLGGAYYDWAVLGFFGRVNYNYEDRYLFEANLRRDGSSRFRADNRWILLPSFSLGWNIAQENFWNVEQIDQLKLRASYGSLGNQNTKEWYPTYLTLPVKSKDGSWLIDGSKPNTCTAPGIISQSLGWERVKSYNVGLDYTAFNNRLSGSFDYYIRETTDMVGPAPTLPNILGTAVPKQNNTDLKTYGWEFAISWKDRILNNQLSYGISAWIADAQTEVTRYPNEAGLLSRYRAGQKLGEIWGYETIGIAKTQEEMDAHLATLPNGGQWGITNNAAGDIMYRDLNGDGRISDGENTESNPGDRRVIGNNTPRYRVGMTLTAEYKGFDFRAIFSGVLKRDYATSSQLFFPGGWLWGTMVLDEQLDYFRTDADHLLGKNLNPYYARPLSSDRNRKTQTRYLLDASYIRCKNITLGYTLPKRLLENLGISNARVYVAGENLFTITGLSKIFDPETIHTTNENRYPLMTTLSFGLSLTL